jgi:hypothetical protein
MPSSTDFEISWVDQKFLAYSASMDPSSYIMQVWPQECVKSITTLFEGQALESSKESLGTDEKICQRSVVMPSSTDFKISWVHQKFLVYSASMDPSSYILQVWT